MLISELIHKTRTAHQEICFKNIFTNEIIASQHKVKSKATEAYYSLGLR